MRNISFPEWVEAVERDRLLRFRLEPFTVEQLVKLLEAIGDPVTVSDYWPESAPVRKEPTDGKATNGR